jgi:hypothetical protein
MSKPTHQPIKDIEAGLGRRRQKRPVGEPGVHDRAVIDRLWNRFIAAWFKGGKDDPKLALLRFDAERAEIWIDASSLVAGIKMLFGADPKKDYKDKVAEVELR